MSTVISRRSFLKCTGASAAALGAASLLGGCKSNGSDTVVEVKVGDTVRNWNAWIGALKILQKIMLMRLL